MLSSRMRSTTQVIRTDFTSPVTSYHILSKPFNFEPGAPETVMTIVASDADIQMPTTTHSITPSVLDLLVPTVSADIPGGSGTIFPINVTLTSSESGNIYYTLDGTYPHSGSALYTSPISITLPKVLRFVGIDLAGNIGVDKTESYAN
jgi:hypothetical protein